MIIVEEATQGDGCLDVAITADLVDPGRVNIFERCESQAAVEAVRRSGPPFEHGAAMLSVSVAEYDVADGRRLFGEGTAGYLGQFARADRRSAGGAASACPRSRRLRRDDLRGCVEG